jgi:hypothetical protein
MANQVVCRIRADENASELEFIWTVGSSAFAPYTLKGNLFKIFSEQAREVRCRLRDLVLAEMNGDPERRRAETRGAAFELARAGSDLCDRIFEPASSPSQVAPRVRGWLRDITRAGEVESVEIVSAGQPWFVPWNLVYDTNPDEDAFIRDGGASAPVVAPDQLRPFWGLQYNLCGGLPVEPLRRRPLPSPPDLLVVADTVVVDDLDRLRDDAGVSERARWDAALAAWEAAGARVASVPSTFD